MGLGSRFRSSVEELAEAEEAGEPSPRAKVVPDSGGSLFSSGGGSEDFVPHDPPGSDMDAWWELYENELIVSKTVNAFATEVCEPGWWIEAESDQTAQELATWLRKAAVINNKPHNDFALMLHQMVVQAIVRGTFFLEHVPESAGNDNLESQGDSFNSIQFLDPTSITPMTREKQSILLHPEDNMPNDEDVPKTENDETPAYVQFYGSEWNEEPIGFARHDVTHYTHQADINELFGNSEVAKVEERVNSLKRKLNDSDTAVAQKAWPIWLFTFGTEDRPWAVEDIQEFMSAQSSDQFTPGTKQAVQGDVDAKTMGGDLPDIQNLLSFDVDYILSGLPATKSATAFTDDNSASADDDAKERHALKKVRQTRRYFEDQLRPMLERKCEVENWDPKGIQLHISPIEGENPEKILNQQGTHIQYSGVGNGEMAPGVDAVSTRNSMVEKANQEGMTDMGSGQSQSESTQEAN